MAEKALCARQGCRLPVDARGLCRTHYSQWRRAKKRAATASMRLDSGLSQAAQIDGRVPPNSDQTGALNDGADDNG